MPVSRPSNRLSAAPFPIVDNNSDIIGIDFTNDIVVLIERVVPSAIIQLDVHNTPWIAFEPITDIQRLSNRQWINRHIKVWLTECHVMRNFLIGARRRSHAKRLPARLDKTHGHEVCAINVILHIIRLGESICRNVVPDARIFRRSVLIPPKVDHHIVWRRVRCPSFYNCATGAIAHLKLRHNLSHIPSNDFILGIRRRNQFVDIASDIAKVRFTN